METYVESLCRELSLLAPLAGPLKTVFFGGGTPTMLSAEQLTRILAHLRTEFALETDVEVSSEANPGSMNEAKFTALREGGVNRISFGAQTFSNRLLMTIGRIHDRDAIIRSVAEAKSAGFSRINLDLMFGLPEQTLADVDESLDAALAMDVEHLSAYWLKVEEGTPFAAWDASGGLPIPGEDEEAEMYALVRKRLTAANYDHYEISNFAKPGGEARHNLVYWHNEPYLAAGAGAHGYFGGERYENIRNLAAYMSGVAENVRPIAEQHKVSKVESMEDTMMLGLRLAEGVSEAAFNARHGVALEEAFGDIVQRLIRRGMLTWTATPNADRILCLTQGAWPIANEVFSAFV